MTRSRAPTPALAFAVAVAGIGLFSIMDAFMKALVLSLGVYNALVWRTGLSTLLAAGIWSASRPRMPAARTWALHGARGAVTAAMALLFFWGLARVPMAQAISLTYIAPLLALLLAAIVLHERVGPRVVVASAVALAGVLVILAGQAVAQLGGEALAGSVAILVSAVLYAVNLVIARLQSQAAGPAEIACLQSGIITAILACAAPWLAVWPDAAQWPRIAIAAMLATGSLTLLAWAYAHGETGFLATTEYTSFVWAAALGWLVFGETVSGYTLAGAAVIVAACLHAARRRDVAQAAVEAAA